VKSQVVEEIRVADPVPTIATKILRIPQVPETEEALEPRKNIKKVAPVPEEKGQVVVTKGHEESA